MLVLLLTARSSLHALFACVRHRYCETCQEGGGRSGSVVPVGAPLCLTTAEPCGPAAMWSNAAVMIRTLHWKLGESPDWPLLVVDRGTAGGWLLSLQPPDFQKLSLLDDDAVPSTGYGIDLIKIANTGDLDSRKDAQSREQLPALLSAARAAKPGTSVKCLAQSQPVPAKPTRPSLEVGVSFHGTPRPLPGHLRVNSRILPVSILAPRSREARWAHAPNCCYLAVTLNKLACYRGQRCTTGECLSCQ